MKRINIVLLFCLVSISTIAQTDSKKGKKLFNTNCVACHGIDKKLIGPPLVESVKKRELSWFVSFVQNNKELRDKGDKAAIASFKKYNGIPMPAYPQLTKLDIQNIIAYVREKSKK